MRRSNVMERLLRLIGEGTSPFQVTSAVERQFQEAGYERLRFDRPWQLEDGGRYYIVQQESALTAFTIGEDMPETGDYRIAAAHTDFPGLRIKQNAGMVRDGYAQLNVEVYGGAILNTWLDRPLSAAGRVALKSDDVFRPQTRLVDFGRPMFVIPNLAIHLNRDINKGVELNRQKDMIPIAGIAGEKMTEDFFKELLASELRVRPDEILDYEIGLYNADTADYVGMEAELLSAPRIDNLAGVQAIVSGMLEGSRDGINVAAFFDHEEIGSKTRQGAGSLFLNMVLEKISLGLGEDRSQYLHNLQNSMMLSVDVGHGFHPNYPEKMDPTNRSVLNHGLCIKEASTQSYATDSRSVAIVQQICMQEEIPYTKFFNRSDGTSGSTLGAISSSLVPVPTADVGIPILAMHSARELMGVKDEESLKNLIRAYYTL